MGQSSFTKKKLIMIIITTLGCWSCFGNCLICTFASKRIRCSLWFSTLSFCI